MTKKTSMIVLAVTALIGSRLLFVFLNDPEGPNLIVIAMLTLLVYTVTAATYLFSPQKLQGIKRFLLAIGVQLLLVIVLYFCMR